MAEAVVSKVLETNRELMLMVVDTFCDLLIEKATSLLGMNKITQLQHEMLRMKDFLQVADLSDDLRDDLRQITDLAYRSEDVLEEYAIDVISKRELSSGGSKIKKLLLRFACFLNEGKIYYNVDPMIIDIKEGLASIRESLKSSGINSIGKDEGKDIFLSQTFPHEDKEFVGMESEFSELVYLVMYKEIGGFHDKVICIWGVGGSGKTEMAKKIYDYPFVKQAFDCFAWVRVTQDYDITDILRDVLDQLSTSEGQANTIYELMEAFMKVFHEKKCLVVLDNIWNVDDCQYLKCIHKEQGKILLTTRLMEVAEFAYVGFRLPKRLLNEEEGLKLLLKKALPQHAHHGIDPQTKEFEQLGKRMIRMCDNLPLLISILLGILRNRVSLKDWEKICEFLELNPNGGTYTVLSLSYDYLPYSLKPCLLYMAGYREGQNIDPEKFYQLWIAERLVSRTYCLEGETLMDVAERFLKNLISRNMVEVEADPIFENLWWCRLHDEMRNFCLSKAKHENFLEIMTEKASPLAARYSIHVLDKGEEGERCIGELDQLKRVNVRAVSIEIVPSKLMYRRELTVKASVEKLKFLRVLDFNRCRFHEGKLPSGIDRLLHLRYLSLFMCAVEKLPSSVGDLPLLQTLDLRTSSKIQIPHDIFHKEKRLLHLYVYKFTCGSERKLNLNGLSKLETFILEMRHENNPIKLMQLSKLTSIREFRITYNGDENEDQGSLLIVQIKSWKKIKRLVIEMRNVKLEFLDKVTVMRSDVSYLEFERVHFSILSKFAQSLESLAMKDCYGLDGNRIMEWVGKIPNLKDFAYVQSPSLSVIHFDNRNFQEIRSLAIIGIRELEELIVSEGSLPNLVALEIDDCQGLKIVPEDGLKYLQNLKELILGDKMLSLKNLCELHQSQYPQLRLIII